MKVDIKERKNNPLLDRKELKGIIDHTGEATPSSEALEKFLSEELGTEEDNIEVDKIFTIKGMNESKFWAKELGKATGGQSKGSNKTEEEEESSGEEEAENYEEVLSGTISESKEAVKGMENPDYEKLLEVEKENKDRKGMKQFLEKNIGE